MTKVKLRLTFSGKKSGSSSRFERNEEKTEIWFFGCKDVRKNVYKIFVGISVENGIMPLNWVEISYLKEGHEGQIRTYSLTIMT